jgi:hypothetical protein
MCSANQKAVALYLVSCLDNRSVLLKSNQLCKTSRLVAPFSILANYRQISILKTPWQPIQSEKTGGFSFEIAHK